MIKKICLLVLFPVLLFFCTSKQKNSGEQVDIHLGKTKNKQCLLSAVADSIRYIQLRTPDSIYITGQLKLKFTENFLLALDRTTQGVFLFDNKGEFIRMIGETGGGPEEYLFPADCIADENSNSIFILDSQKKEILIFDFKGRFKYSFSIPGYPHKFYLYHGSLVFITPNEGKGSPHFPNFYKTDLQGKVLASLKLPELYQQNGFATFSTYFYNDTLVFWQQTSDTIYNITRELKLVTRGIISDADLMPKKLLLSNEEMNNLSKYLAFDRVLEFKEYLYFDAIYKMKGLSIMHNKKSKENFNLIYNLDVWDHGFLNDLDGGPPFSPGDQINEKIFYWILNPAMFLKIYNDPYTQGIVPLKKALHLHVDSLAKSIKPEDNPIIQVAYFK